MDRQQLDRVIGKITFIPAFSASLLLIVMTLLLVSRSSGILLYEPLQDLLFSSVWQPLAGKFGFLPFIAGTVSVTLVAMALSIPISLLTAIYLSQYAHRRVRNTVQPLIDLLAGIPSIIFGLFGVLLIVPLVKDYIAPAFGTFTSGYCVLTGGLVLAIMVVPLTTSIAYEVLSAVPEEMRVASLAMGANRWETVKYVVFRKAFPGIVAAVILGFSRAFGETMAVLMVVGNVAQIPSSLFDPAYPIPALIANNYGEMMSIPLYDSALMFAALLLLIVIVIFNILANLVLIRVKRGDCLMIDWRTAEERIFHGLMVASLLIVILSLAVVFAVVVIRGLPALSLSMITQTPQGGYYLGKGGGILNAIVGSLYLAAGAIALAFVISLPIAWYLTQYAGKSRFASFVRISLDVASGIPSLIYGAFVFIIMIALHERVSLFWGIITVALFITPLLTRGLDEVMQTVPSRLKEASYLMGATRFETLVHVVLRQSLPGIVTAFLLALGRGIGDAASVLFTAGYTDKIPTSLGDAVATLPLAIFFQLGSPVPEVQARAYASGIILLAIVLALSLCSRILSKRFKKYVIK